ncbi:MAG: hypothetical protein WCK80_04125 [bacterium]
MIEHIEKPTEVGFRSWINRGSNEIMRDRHVTPVKRAIEHLDFTSGEMMYRNLDILPIEGQHLMSSLYFAVIEGVGRSGNRGVIHKSAWGMKEHSHFTAYSSIMISLGFYDIVESYLNNHKDYKNRWGKTCKNGWSDHKKDSILSPRTANYNSNEWINEHSDSVDDLTEQGYHAMGLVIRGGPCKDPDLSFEDRVWKNWDGVIPGLARLKRNGTLGAYLYSHEIASTSLLGGVLDPHTHVMLWVKGDMPIEALRASLKGYEVLPDERNRKTRGTGTAFEKFVQYMHKIYSWVDTYQREWTPECAPELNYALKETIYSVKKLYSGRHKMGTSGLPKKKARMIKLVKADLQLEENQYKIKETKSVPEKNYAPRRTKERNREIPRRNNILERSKAGDHIRTPQRELTSGDLKVPGSYFSPITIRKDGFVGKGRVQRGSKKSNARGRNERDCDRGLLQRG